MSGSDRDVFVGRSAELAELERRFGDGARLVTLLGPPGVGKTRLAKRYAGAAKRLGHAVASCSMTAVSDRDGMLRAISQAIDLPPIPSEDGKERMVRALRARGPLLLLVLNLEQVVATAAELVETLLEELPELKLLATSREPLRIAGETRHYVEPLSPEEGAELFCLRADARGADPASLADTRSIAEIVRRLDGLPLAVELAAARAVVLSPAEILRRLERRFELLRRADWKGEPRRATLEASIDASWELLSPAEQSVLAQCSVFPDAFAVDAAEEVIDVGGEGAVLDLLQALRERSLLRSAARPGHGGATTTQLSLYESIRQYAAGKLEELGSVADSLARHARAYAARAQIWTSRAARASREATLAEMAASEAHLIQAQRVASEPADRARLGVALAILLGVWGPRSRQLACAEAAIAAAEQAGAEALLAQALQLRGHALLEVGRADEAVPLLERSVELATRAGDGPTARFASLGLAMIALRQMRLDELEERCMDILDEAGEDEAAVRSLVLSRLPLALTVNDRLADARAVVASELVRARRSGSQQYEAACLMSLALCEHEAGKLASARDHYDQALGLFQVTGPRSETATAHLLAAWVEIEDGQLERAQHHVDGAWTEQRDLADPALEGWTYMVTGVLRLMQGDARAALLAFQSSLEHGRGQSHVEAHARPFAVLALAHAERLEEAEDLLATSRVQGARDRQVLEGLWELAGASIELGRARAASDRAAVAGRHIAAARGVLSEMPSARGESRTFIRNNAIRLLERDLARTEAALAEAVHPSPGGRSTLGPSDAAGAATGRAVLLITPDGTKVLPPGVRRWVDLQRRGPVRRILLRFAEAHRAGEAAPLTVEDLLEAGWPGESVSHEAGVARVYSAIATLRKLGLRDVLETVDGGYRLSPRIDVARE
jgi:predicted ATPase